MLGDRYFGLRGALAALAGMLLVPLVIVLGADRRVRRVRARRRSSPARCAAWARSPPG